MIKPQWWESIGALFVYFNHVLNLHSEDGEEAMCQDTDSDVAEAKDCGKVKVKWTQEEVSLSTRLIE